MLNKKRLFRISFLLLSINLILVGAIFFGQFGSNLKPKQLPSEVKGATSLPVFSPSSILTENDFRSKRAFPTESSIRAYLESNNSSLKNYSDQGKLASYWIWSASNGTTSSKWNIKPNINPAIILTFLEKEQSLVSLGSYDTSSDPENRIANAMGYGCPDGGSCDPQYKGFANQVNWAAYQLEYNIYVATNPSSIDPFKVNSTITTLDNYDIFLSNSITASFYRYTPHVYWSAFNIWLIMTSNGWGESALTYNMSELRTSNLTGVSGLPSAQNEPAITLDQVKNLLLNPPAIGTTGSQIELLQKFLRQEGYFVYPSITGYYGTVTDGALKNYVKDKNITGTSSQTTSDTPECIALYQKNWNIGDENDQVKALQSCLKKNNLFKWPVISGYFGNITNDGLNAIRKKLNLNALPPASNPAPAPTPTPQPQDTCSQLISKNTWKINQQNEEVKTLQGCLRKNGTFNWPSNTGLFGPVTNQALATTLDNLKQTWSCADLKNQVFFENQTSDRVSQLQACMGKEGVFVWPSNTGYFGPVTKASLLKWRGYV